MIPLKFSEPTICRFFASISQRFKMFPRVYFRVIPRSKNYAYAARSPRQLPAAAGRYYADRAKEFENMVPRMLNPQLGRDPFLFDFSK